MKKTYGCAIGCIVVPLVALGSLFLISGPLQKEKNEEAFKRIRSIKFIPGETTLSNLLEQSFLGELEFQGKGEFEGATYLEWDHGKYQGWFLGDPVEDLVIHYHFGAIRVNQISFANTMIQDATYPDQVELEELLIAIEETYRKHTDKLGGGHPQHILYSLQRLRAGDKRYGYPRPKSRKP